MKKFIQELQRRNVIKSALTYLVVAWLITQVMSIVIPAFELPKSLLRASIILVTLGFPFWIVFSWIYEITPEGIKKTASIDPELSIAPQTSNRLNKIIIGALGVAIVLLVYNIISQENNISESQLNDRVVMPNTVDKSIAVLAFADMSPQKDQEYFSDGISEEILNLLAKIPDLKVISRTSSFSFKGKGLDIKEIGDKLQVGNVLEGSIRKSGNTFRITAQLVDANTGVHIWSETYDRKMEDIFKIQDEIATKVTEQLKVSLLGVALTSVRVDTDAYTLFLRASQLFAEGSSKSNADAFKMVRESIAVESSYAPAWSLLSRLFYDAAFKFSRMPMHEAIKQGKLAATKAIVLDPDNVGGYIILAQFENASWDFKERDQLLEKAMLLYPNNPRTLLAKSQFASNSGKMDQAIELLLKTIELDPLYEWNYYGLGLNYWMNGEFAKAEENLSSYLLLYPNSGLANSYMSQVQLGLGHPEKALDYIEKETDPFWHLYRKSMVVYALGNTQEADELLKQFIADYGNDSWPNIADVYAFRNEKDEAFKWLELAFKNKDASLLEILNYPEMKNLWGDPRWNKFINKLGLPEDHGFHLD